MLSGCDEPCQLQQERRDEGGVGAIPPQLRHGCRINRRLIVAFLKSWSGEAGVVRAEADYSGGFAKQRGSRRGPVAGTAS